jgi:hypothetical protein
LALFSLFLFTACGSDDVEQIQSDLATLEAKTDQLTADLNQLQADLNEQAEPATESDGNFVSLDQGGILFSYTPTDGDEQQVWFRFDEVQQFSGVLSDFAGEWSTKWETPNINIVLAWSGNDELDIEAVPNGRLFYNNEAISTTITIEEVGWEGYGLSIAAPTLGITDTQPGQVIIQPGLLPEATTVSPFDATGSILGDLVAIMDQLGLDSNDPTQVESARPLFLLVEDRTQNGYPDGRYTLIIISEIISGPAGEDRVTARSCRRCTTWICHFRCWRRGYSTR